MMRDDRVDISWGRFMTRGFGVRPWRRTAWTDSFDYRGLSSVPSTHGERPNHSSGDSDQIRDCKQRRLGVGEHSGSRLSATKIYVTLVRRGGGGAGRVFHHGNLSPVGVGDICAPLFVK